MIHDKFTDLHKNTRGNERYDAWTNKYVFITDDGREAEIDRRAEAEDTSCDFDACY